MMKVAVTGAGGILGGLMVGRLLSEAHEVYASDIKPMAKWDVLHQKAINLAWKDLAHYDEARRVIPFNCDEVYNLAHDDSTSMTKMFSIDIVSSVLKASVDLGAKRFLQVSAFGHQSFGAELCRVVNDATAVNVQTFTYVTQSDRNKLVDEMIDSMRNSQEALHSTQV